MDKKLVQAEQVAAETPTDSVVMVEIPEDFSTMSDEEIDQFASELWDGFVGE
jgi:hypothetical protein